MVEDKEYDAYYRLRGIIPDETPQAFEDAYKTSLWETRVQIASLRKNIGFAFLEFLRLCVKAVKEKASISQGFEDKKRPAFR